MFCGNNDFRQDDIDINITNQNVNSNENMNYNMNENTNVMGGYSEAPMTMMNAPIVEPGRERVINRTFIHEVPQE